MSMLHARLTETRQPTEVVRTLRYTTPAGHDGEVWWRISDDALPSPLRRHDLAVVALLFVAMREGCDLHVAGPVSWSLLARLEEFQAAWTKWQPRRYRRVAISADEVVMPAPVPGLRAVALFSGGVDSTFTVWRHRNGAAGHASRDIVTAIMIHGFDIPLSAEAAFERAASAARNALGSVDLPLTCVKTNWRSICADWEMEFAAGLAACLRQWQGDGDAGLIGADDHYGALVTPWGSNPITNPLLSSDDFELVFDGGGFTRAEKIAAIAGWRPGVENLRVCWEGPATGENCGVCEKCLRTKLNFMAAGKPLPQSLAGEPTVAQVLRIRARSESQLVELPPIVAAARARGIKAPWLFALSCITLREQTIHRIDKALGRLAWLRAAHHAYQRLKSRSVARREWAQSTLD